MGGHHVRDYVLWESLAVGHPSAVTFRLDTSVQLSRSLSNNEQSVGGRRLVRCSHRAGTLKEINKSCSARHHHKRLKDYNKACIFISALVEKACFGVSWCIRIYSDRSLRYHNQSNNTVRSTRDPAREGTPMPRSPAFAPVQSQRGVDSLSNICVTSSCDADSRGESSGSSDPCERVDSVSVGRLESGSLSLVENGRCSANGCQL